MVEIIFKDREDNTVFTTSDAQEIAELFDINLDINNPDFVMTLAADNMLFTYKNVEYMFKGVNLDSINNKSTINYKEL